VVVLLIGALMLVIRLIEPQLAFFPTAGEDVTPRDFGERFDALTIPTADGERLHAWSLPADSPRAHIIYFHGNGGNLSVWAPILARLQHRGYSVLAVDYRGYGLSTGRPSERGLYRDVDAVLDHVWRDRDRRAPIVYWGRSLGAAMAAYAASVRPPDRVILESSFPDVRTVVRSSPLLALAFAVAAGLRLPRHVTWRDMIVVALVSSTGFTFALFFATVAFPVGPVLNEAKLGALLTIGVSVLATAVAKLLRAGRFAERAVRRRASAPEYVGV